jgi:alkanesulfonate monooxygenase SsuD/methylene tetrahydromethanopterin reductase-like flavin-dependent oxidoreductase (luciferase family)
MDHVCVAGHISFHGGTGFDGLISATSVLSSHDELSVIVGVYQPGLQHPMLAARQLASISQIAPGRLVLGVGVGGEDRSEVSNSGVDPATRGRRLDESLKLMRVLATGEPVDHDGEFFKLEAASILPAPSPRVPIVIGGKGDVAVRRTAEYGDGWLGIFCSARRFAQTRHEIAEAAKARGRDVPRWYGVNVWCGLDPDEGRARAARPRDGDAVPAALPEVRTRRPDGYTRPGCSVACTLRRGWSRAHHARPRCLVARGGH